MNLEVITPEGKKFDDEIYGLKAKAHDGYFMVLKNHAPYVASIKPCIVKILKSKNEFGYYKTNGGFINVSNNKIVLLTETFTESINGN